MIGAVVPAVLGALAGVLAGASVAGYWAVSLLAAVAGFASGFEHPDAWDAADRGFLGGVIYGSALVLVYYLAGVEAKVSLGRFPPLLVIVTAVAGTLLAGAGGRLARTLRERAGALPD
jgi:hypothetical protein